tara:strand:+ start:5506 stop:7329 length:1824 start_codon:yes stop_codon:yes gene_type:complete
MAIRIEAELNANTTKAQKEVEKLNDRLVKISKTAKTAGQDITNNLRAINPIIREIDRFTGGLATKFVDVAKAARLSGKAMKTALISTGIGLIVVALALVVEYWDDITKLIDGVSSEQEQLLKNTQATLLVQQNQLATTNSMENTLKLQGKSEKEIRDIKKEQTNEIIASTELLLLQQKETKKSQVEAAERNKTIATGIIAFLGMPITILLGAVDALTAGLSKIGVLAEGTKLAEEYLDFTSGLLFDPEQVAKDGDEEIKETEKQLIKLKNTRDSFILQDKADNKKAGDDKIKDAEDLEQRRIDAIESIRKKLIDTEEEERLEKLRLIQVDYDEQIRLAEEFYGKKSEKVLELEAAQKTAVDEQQAVFDEQDETKRLEKELADQEKLIEKLEIDKEFSNLNFEEQRELLTSREEALLNDTTLSEEQRTALAAQFAESRTNLAVAEKDAKLATLGAVGSGLQDLASIAGEETAAGKALALAAATINTYAGIAGIWGAAPEGTATTTLIAKIAASVAVASAGFAAVKKIASTQVPATRGGGGGGGGGGNTSYSPPSIPPAFNIVGQSDTNQLADAIGGQMQEPVQAFVVANEITTAQELERNIIDGASIG